MTIKIKKTFTILTIIITTILAGCAVHQNRTRSSVVDYLYPKSSETIVEPSIPVLKLPLKVGIAFVPDRSSSSSRQGPWQFNSNAFTAVTKNDLLQKVADHFIKYKFVSEIEIIPSGYLTSGGSFSNLEQIKTMYGIDIIALVSYDQTQFTDEGFLSFSYWTIIGAYIVKGEKNDTSTMIDTVVYDISSKKMLFRAPGTSNIKGSSTPVNLSESLRADSRKSFNEATENMIVSLDMELSTFKKKVKKNPKNVKIVHRAGYSGGGGFHWLEVFMLLMVLSLSRKKPFV